MVLTTNITVFWHEYEGNKLLLNVGNDLPDNTRPQSLYLYMFTLFLPIFAATELTYTVVKAPATFITVELWHTMYYLMLWQAQQRGELLSAHFTFVYSFWTSVQNFHWICSEAFLTLLAHIGIHMLVHMLPVCNKLWESNIAMRTWCLTNRLQLFSLKHTKLHVMRFFFSSQQLCNWTRSSLLCP
jgi:hypothetical protein